METLTCSAVNKTVVAYYITGHGLGHATRSMELIRALIMTGAFVVHVVSHVSASFFFNSLNDFGLESTNKLTGEVIFSHHDRNLDTGAVQSDVFTVNAKETVSKYYESIQNHRTELLMNEVRWLQDTGVHVVLSDAIPLACVAGHRARVISILVSNFSWDFCFKEMLATLKEKKVLTAEQEIAYGEAVEQAEQDSSSCDLYLQLPGATPLPTGFAPEKVRPGPLIARQPRNRHLRESMGVHKDTKLLLLGFGGHSAVWDLKDSFLPPGWVCWVLGAKEGDLPSPRFSALGHDAYVPDLICAADAVLGKLGYGFVSECITTGTALVYVPRIDWPEERYLEKLLVETYRAGLKMPQEAFVQGHWHSYIEQAAALKGSWLQYNEQDFSNASTEIVQIIQEQLAMHAQQTQSN